jgi:hypothetical protein
VARSSAGRPGADKPESDSNAFDQDISDDRPELDDEEGDAERTAALDLFWSDAKVEPLEIALPGGVGYTLRAYRMNTEITPSDYTAREEDEFPERTARFGDDEDDVDLLDDEDEEDLDDEFDGEDLEDDEDEEDADEAHEEEVPLFLSQGGHLLLFRSRGGLVDFVTSDAEHDLTQLAGWSELTEKIRAEHVVPSDDETYELDLVVKNLRAGSDSWDPDLIVQSGQLARDLGHALRIEPVVKALAAGSPLDDLDEALRAVAAGGVGSFFARRKAKKIGTEAASIGWRTVIGKISAVVDWRD